MKELEKKFKGLIGCLLRYKEKYLKITDVRVKFDKITVYTSLKTFVMFESDAEILLSELEVVENEESVSVSVVNNNSSFKEALVDYGNNADKVTDVLMQQLELISTSDKVMQSQLDKAAAISKIAKTIVDVEKVKLGYINLMTK